MRFMIQVRSTPHAETDALPDPAIVAAMVEYHEQLAAAGVLLDANGLRPSAFGWRIRYDEHGGRRVVDGPFAESKELIAGYTLIQVRSRDEALEWSRRFPAPFEGSCEVEVRQLFELEEIGADAQSEQRFRALGVGA